MEVTRKNARKFAPNLFEITSTSNIKLSVFWIPRKYNTQVGALSKNMENNHWVTISKLIDFIHRSWSNIMIDIFASDKKRKSKRFNSRYLCPKTEGVNIFSLDWSNKLNLLVPVVESRAVIVCPSWPSATFWLLLHKKVTEFHEFVDGSFALKDTMNYIKLRENEKPFMGLKKFQGWILSLIP